ncbi:MAG TPA: hypothetical protein VFD92_19840 [Candidatus Binatia bacterium]|nr:hypothetical protein [Candidatus Binatia bacterium]
MSRPTIRDVFGEIEFELAQGLVARPELRKALRDLRAFHERARADVFGRGDGGGDVDLRDALSRQFQINDMILALLGDVVEAAHEARTAAREVHGYVREVVDGDGRDDGAQVGVALESIAGAASAEDAQQRADAPGAPIAVAANGARRAAADPAIAWEPELDPLEPFDADDADPEEEIEWAMRPERLWLSMDARAARLPLVGTMLRRFRTALHTRVLIYAGQLGDKQGAVNRILGDHLLRAIEGLRGQARAIAGIRVRLHRLEARLERGERPSRTREPRA